jgi:hypothetical protein
MRLEVRRRHCQLARTAGTIGDALDSAEHGATISPRRRPVMKDLNCSLLFTDRTTKGAKSLKNWLTTLDDFRNYLIHAA